MGSCKSCNGNCAGCGGCEHANTLSITNEELEFLRQLGQFSFLPVARKADDMIPVFLEDDLRTPDAYANILACLEKKSLIDLDYHAPLRGFSYHAYAGYPVHGTVSLTQRGLAVLELLEIQGFAAEE